MKRRIALLLAVLCLLSALTGCGGGKKKAMDPKAFVDELMAGAKFQDSLTPLDERVVPIIYGVDEADYKSALVYAGTAATAEEIAVFEAVDDAAAKRLLDACRARVDHQIESYKSYGPEAARILGDGIVDKTGNYVVVVICSDTEGARKIADQYI